MAEVTEVDHIEIPDTTATYVLFTKNGYLLSVISYLPGYVEESREAWFFDHRTLSFFPPSDIGIEQLSEDITTAIRVKPEQAEDFIILMAYTNGVDPEQMETYHVSQLEHFIEHTYGENSEFYPAPGEGIEDVNDEV